MTSSTSSDECRTLPPVVTDTYKAKGKYIKLGDLDGCYVTGNESSKHGIIFVYDAFGLMPQTLQGADRLASSLNCLVVMPDFFKGSPAIVSWLPPDTEEKKKLVDNFMKGPASFPDNMPVLIQSAKHAKNMWPSVESWGCFGLCWGGKLVAMASGADTLFKVSGQAHPSRPSADDARAFTIPHTCLAAPTDDRDGGITEYAKILPSPPHHVETYTTMFHGWMGARADLTNEDNAKEFTRGYGSVADFFKKHL